jgi:cell division protein FtsZ
MRVSVVATGISNEGIVAKPRPQMTLVSSQETTDQILTSKADVKPEASRKVDELNNIEPEPLKKTGTNDVILNNDIDAVSQLSHQLDAENSIFNADKIGTAISEAVESNLVAGTLSVSHSSTNSELLSAQRTTDFIPAAPILTEKSVNSVESKSPDPFNAAAIINTGISGQTRKGRSLFQRVTGMGKKNTEIEEASDNIQNDFLKSSLPIISKEKLELEKNSQNTNSNSQETSLMANQVVEESLLDIPAFLRRQSK